MCLLPVLFLNIMHDFILSPPGHDSSLQHGSSRVRKSNGRIWFAQPGANVKKLLSSSLTLGQIRRLMSSVGSAESNRRFNLRPREHLAYFHNLQSSVIRTKMEVSDLKVI